MKTKLIILAAIAVIVLVILLNGPIPLKGQSGASISALKMGTSTMKPADPSVFLEVKDSATLKASLQEPVLRSVEQPSVQPEPSAPAAVPVTIEKKAFSKSILSTFNTLFQAKPVVSVPKVTIPSFTTETIEGVFIRSHFDDFKTGKEIPSYSLMTSAGITGIDPASVARMGDSRTYEGATIRITGSRKNGIFSVTSPDVTLIKAATKSPRSSRLTGPIKISLVLYKFANDTGTPPFTKDDVRKNFFEPNADSGLTMSQFLEKTTYGRVTLTGTTSADGSSDVYGWYTVSQTRSASCANRDYSAASNEAIAMAVGNGLQLGPDDFVIVGTYPEGCPIGGHNGFIAVTGNDADTTVPGIPLTQTIVMSDMMAWGNILHEFGHGIGPFSLYQGKKFFNGAEHSNALNCQDSGGNKVLFGTLMDDFCSKQEYGSPLSVMGGFVSGAQKVRMFDGQNLLDTGDLNASNQVVATSSGTYDMVKSNYSDATILRMPVTLEQDRFNGLPVGPSKTGYIDIEARDFLSFERSADTFPHENIVSFRRGADVLDVVQGQNSKILGPGSTANLTATGIMVSNVGQTPGDTRKVRVTVTYTRPLAERVIRGLSLRVTQSPRIVNVASDGTFPQQEINFEYRGIDGNARTTLPLSFMRSFPSPSQGALPIDGVLNNWANLPVMSANVWSTIHQGSSFSIRPLERLVIDPAVLANHPRFVYSIQTGISPMGDQYAYPITTFLVYGKFTYKELESLGISPDLYIEKGLGHVQVSGPVKIFGSVAAPTSSR